MPLTDIGILHEDPAFLIVDKPTLLLSVPGRAEDNKDCLITRLQDNGYPEARIVHRLDWETSGILVIARDPDSHRELSRQFHDRETGKRSIALCWGQPEADAGHIDLPLRSDPPNKPRQLHDRRRGRRHMALCWRHPGADAAPTAPPLLYDPPNNPRHRVDHAVGRPPQTFWQVLERRGDYCRLELTPITGRSHQLRVH